MRNFSATRASYTKALLAAVPDPDLDRKLDFAALMEGKASDPAPGRRRSASAAQRAAC
jgi:peptide/nickel transport system ATP-binding protein